MCAFVCVLHLPAGTGLRGFSTFSTYTREKRFFIFLEEVLLLLLLVPESIDSAVEGSPLRILQVCACDEPLRVVVVCAPEERSRLWASVQECEVFCLRMLREEERSAGV